MYWRHVLASTVCSDKSKESESVVTKGKIEDERVGSDSYQQTHMDMIFRGNFSFSGYEQNKVFLGRGGDYESSYSDLSRVSGADTDADCRAVVVADFDDDGDCDVFTNAIQRDVHYLFRNDLPNRKSVKLRLRATTGHPSAIGATVIAHYAHGGRGPAGSQAQVLACGSGFESQSAAELVFAAREGSEYAVLWPGTAKPESFGKLAAGRYTLTQGSGKAIARAAQTFAFADAPPRGVKVRVGTELRELDVLTVDGQGATARLTGGKPVLVNFWATTCASCLAEMPEFARLHKAEKYRVIAISLDPSTRVPAIEKLRKRLKMEFDVYRLGETKVGELFDTSRLAIPVTFVVEGGKITRILQGKIKKGDL